MSKPFESFGPFETAGSFRAADNDRAAVAEELSRAHAEGRLTLAEFDERTRAAYQARTYADLAPLTADLPRDALHAPHAPPPSPPPARSRTGTAAKVMSGAWFAASSVNFLIWGVISLSVGEALHPWWIWVAGPWGLVLLAGHLARFGRSS
ncbi:DUF1707 SHOCT-like domain-containing protein [Saccharothrix luteola]|uniref:DUF1707 SHOCT-like domain-containing protein n=1 Tax=Saccharothrix luteola TaxID=2893018 RepID=UPI001E5F488D|nr:DUF1707 domain-containing protein [Saccharothrix luteola]MCC8244469.1 DUF1707 domain-containing protein [Saccharothrix luteola]